MGREGGVGLVLQDAPTVLDKAMHKYIFLKLKYNYITSY